MARVWYLIMKTFRFCWEIIITFFSLSFCEGSHAGSKDSHFINECFFFQVTCRLWGGVCGGQLRFKWNSKILFFLLVRFKCFSTHWDKHFDSVFLGGVGGKWNIFFNVISYAVLQQPESFKKYS